MLLDFVLLSLYGLIGTAAFCFVIFISTQSGQWLDKLLNVQAKLREWDISGTTKGMILSKIFGYCEVCFSHLFAFIGFWLIFILKHTLTNIEFSLIVYFVWYIFQVSISTNLNLYFITKLFKK